MFHGLVALSVLFAAALESGCAKRVPPPPSPINGQCGVTQDSCVLGNPFGTGETSSPYGWSCVGLYGGSTDTCSVPTAALEPGEVFAGQDKLAEKVQAAGPLRGLFTIWDPTIDDPNCTPPYCHALIMMTTAREMGIPEENLALARKPYRRQEQEIWDDTLVAAIPYSVGGVTRDRLARLKSQMFLEVRPAGNTNGKVGAGGGLPGYEKTRDIWYPEHPIWSVAPGYPGWGWDWDLAFEGFATGKFIIAKHVVLTPTGEIAPYEREVKCGLAKEFCYSVIQGTLETVPDDAYTKSGSSFASVELGALAFYLSQLWDTPQEVVGVLNVCAEDVGEPGIDEEFGRGVVSVVCDVVQGRERSVAAASMRVDAHTSPVLAEMLYRHQQPAMSAAPEPAFRPFYALSGYNLETLTGHAGAGFPLVGTDLFVSGGAGYAPLGVWSSLLRRAVRTPFAETGGQRTLFASNGHALTLLGTYGFNHRDALSVHTGRLGFGYDRRFERGLLTLHVGFQHIRARVGIPGYRRAHATPTLFGESSPEIRLVFTLY